MEFLIIVKIYCLTKMNILFFESRFLGPVAQLVRASDS